MADIYARAAAFKKLLTTVRENVFKGQRVSSSAKLQTIRNTPTAGFVNNKVKNMVPFSSSGKTPASNTALMGGYLGQAGGKVLSAVLPIPGLPTVINEVVTHLSAKVLGDALYEDARTTNDPDVKATTLGEYTALKGAQNVADAIRKLNEARAALEGKADFKNCNEMNDVMFRHGYYRYRVERLRYYLKLMQEYLTAIEDKVRKDHEYSVKWEQDWTIVSGNAFTRDITECCGSAE
jgi:hypothetical protein